MRIAPHLSLTKSAFRLAWFVGAIGCSVPTHATDDCTTPLPRNMEVVAPTPTTPVEFAKFVGVWGGGKWDDKLCHTLVVESVDPRGNVRAIYSYGTYEGWDIHNADWFRPTGTIKGGVLKLTTFRNGAEVTYRMEGDSLSGEYLRRGNVSLVDLVRVEQ